MKLSQRIMLVVSVIVLVVTAGLGAVAMNISSNSIMRNTEEVLVTTAQEGAKLIETTLDRELRVLGELALRSEVRSMRWATQRNALLHDVERLGYLDFGIITPDGNVTYVLTEETAWLGDRVYFQRALEGVPNVSDVMISRVTNRPVVMFAVPIKQDDEVVGVLVARKDAGEFSSIVDQMGYGENGYAFILGKDGTIFAHRQEERVLEQQNVFLDIESDGELKELGLALRKLGVGNAGSIRYRLGDVEVYMGVAPINNTDWIFAEGAPKAVIIGWVWELQNALVVGAAGFLILGVIAAYAVGTMISRPIVYVTGILEKLARYDLTFNEAGEELAYQHRKDEIGNIAKSLARMHKNLLALVKEIQEKAEQVASFAEELTATSQESSASAMEVARAIQEIARGAADQASETEKGASHVADIGENIEHNQQVLEEVNSLTERIVALKDESLQVIETLMTRTADSMKAAETVGNSIAHTNESVQKIEAASQMIKSIAAQTNLLALNAAIEAARAGEAGKGFAVVADEIRKLAEQSNSFTNEISAIIQDLLQKTAATVSTMEGVSGIVNDQTNIADKTYDRFNDIAAAIEEMKRAMLGFRQSMEQMGSQKDVVLDVIQNLSAIAEENAAGTEEASASVEEQTSAIEQISAASSTLAQLSQEMLNAVEKFKY